MIVKTVTKPTGHENACHVTYATQIWGNMQVRGMGCTVTVASYKSKADMLDGKQADIETNIEIDATECILAAVNTSKGKTFDAVAFYTKAEEILIADPNSQFFGGVKEV